MKKQRIKKKYPIYEFVIFKYFTFENMIFEKSEILNFFYDNFHSMLDQPIFYVPSYLLTLKNHL